MARHVKGDAVYTLTPRHYVSYSKYLYKYPQRFPTMTWYGSTRRACVKSANMS